MLNCKVKSVFKTIGIISLVLIICYIEGRFHLVFKEKSSMTILSSEFEVFGTVQGKFRWVLNVLTLPLKVNFC